MAWQLVREVLDHSPPGLTPAERLVLIAIAESARKEARQYTGPQSEIARRAGLGVTGVRAVLRKLAQRGLDARVPLTKDKDGRAVYAVPGRSPSFVVPELAPPGCTCSSCGAEGVTSVTAQKASPESPLAREGVTSVTADDTGVTGRRHGHARQASPASRPLRPEGSEAVSAREASAAETVVMDRLGCSLEAAAATLAAIPKIARGGVRNPAGYVRAISVAELREYHDGAASGAKVTRSDIATAKTSARDQCTECSDIGNVIGPDGHDLDGPTGGPIRCSHPNVPTWRRSGAPVDPGRAS